eukprot:15365858-Ditylum_brightwellii.AAC.1
MFLESVDVIFIVSRSNIYKPRLLTNECNNHTFDGWRSSKRKFNIGQAILIKEKRWVQTKNILESNFKAIQLNVLRAHSYPSSKNIGPVEVDLVKTAVEQLWEEAKDVIHELFPQKHISVPSIAEKDDVAESNEGDSAAEEASLDIDINKTGKDNAISSSDELKPDRMVTMVTKIQ